MKYYRTDSRKISFGEYWHFASGTGLLIAWLRKSLGLPFKLTEGIPEQQPFREQIVEPAAVPPQILSQFQPGQRALQELGFNQFWFYALKNSLIGGAAYGLLALHSSGEVVGRVIFASYQGHLSLVVVFTSELADGRGCSTTNNKPQFKPPPKMLVQRQRPANPAQLWELHQKLLAKFRRTNPPIPISDFDQVAAREDRNAQRLYQNMIARGIWIEMTEAEVEVLRAKR